MFRYTATQRNIARAIVRGSKGWPKWAADNGIVSRQLTTPELNRAIKNLNLRLELFVALRKAGQLPIWDRSVHGWVPKTPEPVKQESVEAIKAPDVQSLLDLVAEMEARTRQLEIWCGLRFADPHELDDVGMQKSHVSEQYEAFDFHNPRP
jgi:hypothetical protein